MTIHKAILYGENLLRQSGVEAPRWNAEQILILTLKHDRSRIYAEMNRELTLSEIQSYSKLLQRRADHYPLAYLYGTQDFFGRLFYVDENVLIPRPETEEVIHAVLMLSLPSRPRILDLGSGSGNIAVTLALEIPDSKVTVLEISNAALPTLRRNAQDRILIVRGNLFSPPFFLEAFDAITANPPYVEGSSLRNLPAETRWEPRMALVTESLEGTYRALMTQAVKLLKHQGYLIFEIGYGQVEKIQALCSEQKALTLLMIRKDQREIPRTFVLQKG